MPSEMERLREALAPEFTVERKIATGGMGTVFLGRDERLDRPVAIKILRPEVSTAVMVERFLREARYLATLNHPNILPVHTAGDVGGLVYYIMDYLEGETLDTHIARRPLGLPEVVSLGRGLLSGLATAHAKGIIHRDIKPSNIFLVDGRALLGDFGIAHTVSADETALTQAGDVIGTRQYMAPEQASGGAVSVQSDLYSVGLVLYEACAGRRWAWLALPEEGDWSGVPRQLVPVLWKALERAPADRWADARSFARALEKARSRGRLRLAPLVPLSAAALYLVVHIWPEPGLGAQHVAIYPFEAVGLADTAFGDQLARATASYLEALPGLTVAPVRTTFRQWRASPLPPAERLARLSSGVGAKYGVWSVVRPAETGVEVRLQVVDAEGQPRLETVLRGDTADLIGLSDSIVLQLVDKVFPYSEQLYRSAGGLSGKKPRAVREFLFGEDASERDAWLTAERHYLNALSMDSTFVLAAWRLANARRWMPLRPDPPLPVNFSSLYRLHGDKLSPLDRLLIDAQFAPGGKPRLELYERAVRLAPRDAYAALFYGDELFHRGPLSGRSRDDAIARLQHAVALDSSLAPAHEHLAWALLRSGRKEEARRSLDALHRTAGSPQESEIYLPIFLELAYALRFAPDQSLLSHPVLQSPFELSLAARGGLSVEMPELEAVLGARLAGLRAAPPALHGSGHLAQGLGLVAMGRPAGALAHFDSAARLLPDADEARLQAAEWRVMLSALGMPGVPAAEIDAGRRELERPTSDSARAVRAAWVLALDAEARGDTAHATELANRLASGPGARSPFDLLTRAMRHASAGRFEDALQLSAPALAFDSAGRAGDPFFRSALHLKRGDWQLASKRPRQADAEWLWYEGLDVVGWPSGPAQAGEIDWALGTLGRLRRARAAHSPGNAALGCRLMTEIAAAWSKPDPAIEPLVAEARGALERCPR